MDTLEFKNWLEELDPNQQGNPEDMDPNLGTAARAAKQAVQNAVNQGKNPVQAAQKVIAQNKNIPLNKLGKIMPVVPGSDPNKRF